MTIANYLKQNPDLRYEYKKEHKEPLLRNSVKIYLHFNDNRDKDLSQLCKQLKLPYSLIPDKKQVYYFFITPHIYE